MAEACLLGCNRELPEPDSPEAAGWWVDERIVGPVVCPECYGREFAARPLSATWRRIGEFTAEELEQRAEAARLRAVRVRADLEAERLRAWAEWYDELAGGVK
jgi:hypothetical protein